MLAFFAPLLVRGEVISAHDNSLQLGLEPREDAPLSNLRYSDHASAYIPELHALHHAPRHGWIATWTDAVEMGRPLSHVSGFSPAYLPARLLALVFDDAYVLYTALVLLTVLGTALFAFQFFAALELHPAACFAGALGLALGPTSAHWLTFAMYPAGFAWTLALLWLVTRFAREGGPGRGLGIAFCLHALLLSGYPQHIVWHAYALAGWSVVCLARASRESRLARAAGLGLAVAFGVLAALPVYADLALAASRSARVSVEFDFFFAKMPRFETLADGARYLAMVLDPRWFGNPVDPGYPLFFGGVAWGPVYLGLAALSFVVVAWRDAGWWQALLLVCGAMTAWPALYTFGIEHLGLGFSRALPLFGAWIPGMVCAALALDRLLRAGAPRLARGTVVVLALAGAAAWGASTVGGSLSASALLASAGLLTGLLVLLWRPLPALAAALAIASALHEGLPLVLARPRASIAGTSPLVERLREETRDGKRYALVGTEGPRLLPPNEELLLGLASIHSYDSLSPLQYQDWTARISETGSETRGRKFTRIADMSRLASDELGYANVGVVASPRELDSPALARAGSAGPWRLYRPTEMARPYARLAEWTGTEDDARLTGLLAARTLLPIACLSDEGDRQVFTLGPWPGPTLVFVSRQAHPQWIARADGAAATTVRINGLYQGVVVPAGARTLELEFRPWVRWAWVPQAAFVLLAALVFIGVRRGRRDPHLVTDRTS